MEPSKDKKKIAVYFSGRCTGYEKCLDKLKQKFFDKYDCDFYWSIDEEKETPYYVNLRELLKPKAVYFEKIDKKIVEVPMATQETLRRNSLCMFYHNLACTKLIAKHSERSNVRYHAIVRFRIEIDSENDFVIPDILIENTIYVPNGYNYRGVCDRVAYGTVRSMKYYGELYLQIHNYVYSQKAFFNPEYLLMFHINARNMNLIRFPYEYRLHPERKKESLPETQ